MNPSAPSHGDAGRSSVAAATASDIGMIPSVCRGWSGGCAEGCGNPAVPRSFDVAHECRVDDEVTERLDEGHVGGAEPAAGFDIDGSAGSPGSASTEIRPRPHHRPRRSRAVYSRSANLDDKSGRPYPRSPQLSAEDGRTGFPRRNPDQAAALFDHGGPVVVPVWMLPGDGAVVLHQRFHCLGQADDLNVAAELRPVAKEPVIEHAQPGSGVAADVCGLDCGFAGTDDQTILGVDADEYRGQLGSAVAFHGGKN